MIYETLHVFSSLTASLAGLAIGGCAIIVAYYWRIWRTAKNGARLLPMHVMAIAVSYATLAAMAVVRIDEVPAYAEADVWWTYPVIAFAFLLGDAALVLILLFLRGRDRQAHQ